MTDLTPAASSVLARYRQHGLDPVQLDALHARLQRDLGFAGAVAPPQASASNVVWSGGRFLRAFGLLVVVTVHPAAPGPYAPQLEHGHEAAPSWAKSEPSLAVTTPPVVPPPVVAVATTTSSPPAPRLRPDTNRPSAEKAAGGARRTAPESGTQRGTPKRRAQRRAVVPPAATEIPSAPNAGFAQQLRLIKAAQRDVTAGKHSAALATLAQLDRLAGDDPTFAAERLLLLATARCGLGHKDVARRVADRLERQYPKHALVHKARRVCE